MSFKGLSDILSQVRRRYPALSHRIRESEAMGRWELAVGPIIAKHARAIRVQDAILWVEVAHPIWRSELHHRKHQILKLLNGETVAAPSAAPSSASAPPPGSVTAAGEPILKDIFFIQPRPVSRAL